MNVNCTELDKWLGPWLPNRGPRSPMQIPSLKHNTEGLERKRVYTHVKVQNICLNNLIGVPSVILSKCPQTASIKIVLQRLCTDNFNAEPKVKK